MSTTSVPPTARTLLLTDVSTSALSLIPDYPVPTPAPNTTEHLVRVHATALCARELLWPKWFPGPDNKLLVPGYDLAGEVVTSPADSPFRPGDRVYGRTNYWRSQPGCARDYTIALTEELARVPKNIDMTTAATVSLSALTAWQALVVQTGFTTEGLRGKRLLVTAASGGVGLWVVQMAKLWGMEVVGTCGTDNVEFVKSLGADQVLDYRKTSIKDWVEEDPERRRVDAVVECVGGSSLEQAWYAVKEQGVFLGIVQAPAEKKPKELEGKKDGVTNKFFIMEPNGKQLAEITTLLEEGRLKPVVDSVWELKDYAKAFERLDGGHARGKIVLRILDAE